MEGGEGWKGVKDEKSLARHRTKLLESVIFTASCDAASRFLRRSELRGMTEDAWVSVEVVFWLSVEINWLSKMFLHNTFLSVN